MCCVGFADDCIVKVYSYSIDGDLPPLSFILPPHILVSSLLNFEKVVNRAL